MVKSLLGLLAMFQSSTKFEFIATFARTLDGYFESLFQSSTKFEFIATPPLEYHVQDVKTRALREHPPKILKHLTLQNLKTARNPVQDACEHL